jgi:uncharacterized protein
VTEAVVVLGAFCGGFASGLTGFGFGLGSLPFWAFVLAPTMSAPLVMACSFAGQLQTLPAIWRHFQYRRLALFVLPGLLGIPLGAALLAHVSPAAFRLAFGVLLMVSCGLLLALRVERRRESAAAGDAAVGFCGGILGGLTGLSGILPTLWAEVHGWGKDERRALFQGFNFSILVVSLATLALSGGIGAAVLPMLLLVLPVTFLGVFLGRRLYTRVDARRFSRAVLVLLTLAGAGLVVTTLAAR